MCGIVAALAHCNVVPMLLSGLRRLEYRGYDSAGLAVLKDGLLHRIRSQGRVADLEKEAQGLTATTGIAHTRWATHGVPSERNAHPHISGELAVVHNGIIENYESLRDQLRSEGYIFTSETDTEVIAHLIHSTLQREPALFLAVQSAVRRLQGAYAIAVIQNHDNTSNTDPDPHTTHRIIVARNGSPLLLGIAEKGPESGYYAASDASALLGVTRHIIYLENGDVAELTQEKLHIVQSDGRTVERPIVVSNLSTDAVELGQYKHYMQKEIFEQPTALANTLEVIGITKSIQVGLFGAQTQTLFARVQSVLILACGTSSHAGMVARYWIEALAGIPCQVEIASEYRYRTSVPHPNQLVVAVSQSGETADTLAALHHAQSLGQELTLSICNVPESAIVRETALHFITRAGPEIGVASTKAFTTQLAAFFLLALTLAKMRDKLDPSTEARHLEAMRHLPVAVSRVLALEPQILVWAQALASKQHALFLGRGMHYPIALEGALKLKELSYIHAEAYPSGELKHGPLALVDQNMPVIAIAPNDVLLGKLKSNLQEVEARGGQLYVIADNDSIMSENEKIHMIRMPEHYGLLSPVLHVIPLQLLAYHTALAKSTDVDKPRNLAKSVTVE